VGALVLHQWNYFDQGHVDTKPRVLNTNKQGEVVLSVREGANGIQVLDAHPDFATRGVQLNDLDELQSSEVGLKELVLELERGYEAEGMVVNEDGEPVAHVMVDLDPLGRADFTDWMRFASYSQLKHLPDMVSTDSDGRFLLLRVAEGEYEVTLVHRDYHPDPENPPLRVGPSTGAWIGILRSGLGLTGLILDDKGDAVEGAVVTLLRVDDIGRAIKGFSKVVRTGKDGAFATGGIVPAKYQALFSGPAYLRHSEMIETYSLPQPWKVILQRRDLSSQGPSGIFWLRVHSREDRLIEGTPLVSLYRTVDGVLESSFREDLHAGEVYQPEVPTGTFHVVVEIEGYSPALLPFVEVKPIPDEPMMALLSSGESVGIEVFDATSVGILTVTEARFGLKVAQAAVRSLMGQAQTVKFRLEPGSYAARLRLEAGGEAEGFFLVSPSLDSEAPRLRMEAPHIGPPKNSKNS